MEVAAHEALARQTYKDSAGALTWCVGMTNATSHRVEHYIGKPQSVQHCMGMYAWALTNYAAPIIRRFAVRVSKIISMRRKTLFTSRGGRNVHYSGVFSGRRIRPKSSEQVSR